MMRPATLILLIAAGAAGAALFRVSYDVSALDERLQTLNRQIVADQQAIHVLRAEWSFLNQPARLEELSRRYLDLQPLAGAQIAGAAALPVRLPVAEETPDRSASKSALVALTDDLAASRPLFKPVPPIAHDIPRPVQTTRRSTVAIPVAARSLDDVLADLTGQGGRR